MPESIQQEMARIERLTIAQLVQRYEQLCGEPPTTRHKRHLVRQIVWRQQAATEGNLSERALRRAAELADDANLRITAPRDPTAAAEAVTCAQSVPAGQRPRDRRLPMPGTIITRQYKGETLQVTVNENDFEYQGKRFSTLTAVVKSVTGTHWNGYHFFGLNHKKRSA